MDELRIDVSWLAKDVGDAPERESYGELYLAVGDGVLTTVYDDIGKTVRERARVSMAPLARWLAGNWWRLRWEPERGSVDYRLAHDMRSAGAGFVWPPLLWVGDGETLQLRAQRQGSRSGLLRYLPPDGAPSVAMVQFEHAVDMLMETVLTRLAERDAKDDELAEMWSLVQSERRDPLKAALRRREALLGLDPDELDGRTLARTFAAGEWMGTAAWDEVIAASPVDVLPERAASLETLRSDSAETMDVGLFLTARAAASGGRGEPWRQGSVTANQLRRSMGLGTAPLPNTLLSQLLGTNVDAISTGGLNHEDGSPSLAAGVLIGDGSRVRPRLRSRHPHGRRFEIARMIGDAVMAPPHDVVLPVTELKTARQKAQRAFAQELLCPKEALERELPPEPTEIDVEELSARFEVSEMVIKTALQNHRLVEWDYFGPLSR